MRIGSIHRDILTTIFKQPRVINAIEYIFNLVDLGLTETITIDTKKLTFVNGILTKVE